MMGNPYLRKHSAKSVSVRPFRQSGRDMSFLPVPLTTLDGGTQESTSLSTTIRHQFPHVLLVECMLERMCAIYETDSGKQKELYDAIRRYFIRFRLLPPYAGFPEMDGVRLRLGSDLNNLFHLAKLQITTHNQPHTSAGPLVPANPSPFSGSVWSTPDGSEHLFTSRYEMDFKEMEFIAAGGFGVVFKAHNILDNNEYAIKKIIIGPRSASKVLREVHLLSQLHHPNIVAYKSAWLEYCPPQTMHRILQYMDGLDKSTQDGASITLSSSYSRELNVVFSSERVDSSSNSDSVVFESTTPTETTRLHSSQSNEMSVSTRSLVMSSHWRFNRVVSSPVMLLYIQMQLCPQTLRNWIDNRNGGEVKLLNSIDLELSIFRKIVEGINYIHSSNIIHRDIKPENIFVNTATNQVLIGDFGLAVLGFRSDPNSSALLTPMPGVGARAATRGVGTHVYAAPEQIANREPDAKSDIFSLGIVFLELLNPFKTVMERYKTIEKLCKHGEVPDHVELKWPRMANLMLKMTSRERTHRPSAEEIIDLLDSLQSPSKKTTTATSSHLSKKELLLVIEDLRRQLAEKDLLIDKLTKNQHRS